MSELHKIAADPVLPLLARRDWLLKGAAAADARMIAAPEGSEERAALSDDFDEREERWEQIEHEIAEAPATTAEGVKAKLRITVEALMDTAGGDPRAMSGYLHCVVGALRDLERLFPDA